MNDAGAQIRPIREDEWKALRALRLRALADAPMAFGSTLAEEEARPESFWQERVRLGGGGGDQVVYVFGGGDGLLGMVRGVLDDAPGSAHLYGMYVEPSHRGAGYGHRLVDAICDWADRAGRQRVVLDVTETNQSAIRLYRSSGFVPTGRSAPLPHMASVREIEMQRSLSGQPGL